jgi:methylglutamate dehydrogenase subunit D
MLERVSALHGIPAIDAPHLRMQEDSDFLLTQLAQPSKQVVAILGKLPDAVGTAVVNNGRTLMAVGPGRFWIVGPRKDEATAELTGKGVVTPLSSSRTRIVLDGTAARIVLARSSPLDFDAKVFKIGQFTMTGVHHTPVLVHCTGEQSFHVYALRTFALSVWDWFRDIEGGLSARHP